MSPYISNVLAGPGRSPDDRRLAAAAWQESWDRQQQGYLPDREERLRVLVDLAEAAGARTAEPTETGEPAEPAEVGALGVPERRRPVRVLDLAGGTGSISLRVLRRLPDAELTLVDVDPVLLAIADASLATAVSRGTAPVVVSADLREPGWRGKLPHREYDAILTATALHWLPAERLRAVYAEARDLLRPGGVFVNADHMPDPAIPRLSELLSGLATRRREALHATAAAMSWGQWWEHVAADPALGPLVEQRQALFGGNHAAEWNPPQDWHLDALRAAGYSEVGVIWRGGQDAAVAGVR